MQEEVIAPAQIQAPLLPRPTDGEAERKPAFLTVEEVADLLRVDAVTIYRAIRDGEFPAVKVRKRYTVPRRAIEMLVDDVVATGGCVDAAEWTSSWRQSVGVPLEVPSWAR